MTTQATEQDTPAQTLADGWYKVAYPNRAANPDIVLIKNNKFDGESVNEWIRMGFVLEPVHVLTPEEYAPLVAMTPDVREAIENMCVYLGKVSFVGADVKEWAKVAGEWLASLEHPHE